MASPPAALSARRVGAALGLLLMPVFVAIGAPSVALPAIGRALGVPFGATAWVIDGWALAAAVAMPLVGRLAGRWGVRRSMIASVALLVAGSVAAAGSSSLALLTAGRVLGGLGGGGIVITSYATVDGRLSGGDRLRALAVIAAFVGTASGTGTLVGGVLTQSLGWRWVIAVPAAGVLGAVPAIRLAPGGGDRSQRVDLAGAALLAAVGGAVIALLQARATQLRMPVVLVLIATAVIGGAALVLRVRRHAGGVVPRTVVSASGFLAACLVGLTTVAGYYGLLYAAPELLERSFGWSSLIVGLVLLPAALLLPAGRPGRGDRGHPDTCLAHHRGARDADRRRPATSSAPAPHRRRHHRRGHAHRRVRRLPGGTHRSGPAPGPAR